MHAAQAHALEVRGRLRNPPNAVADHGIDLHRKPEIASIPLAPAMVEPCISVGSSESSAIAVQVRMGKLREELARLEARHEELTRQPRRRLRIEDIQRATASYYGCTRMDLLSPRRQTFVVNVRHKAMYLAKTMTPLSLPQIGRSFGGRDHSTVLHAVRKITELRKTDSALDGDLAMFEQQLSID